MLDENKELNWKITNEEQNERKQKEFKLLLKSLPFVGLLLLVSIHESLHLDFILLIAVILLVSVVVLFVWDKISNKVEERAYFLNEDGLTISKGDKIKSYAWRDFEYYYLYSIEPTASENKKFSGNSHLSKEDWEYMVETQRQFEKINGSTFYLKKKSKSLKRKLFKTFVVVQAEPDNSVKVNEFLSRHLNLEKMTSTTDLGLVSYEFK